MRTRARAARATGLLLLLPVVVAVALLGTSVPASAHAALIGSDPAQGQQVTRAPKVVTLRFDESIRDHSQVIVTGPDGRRVDHGATEVVDNRAEVAVTVRYAGTYTVAYRVISADGHPVAATRTFDYDNPQAPVAPQRVAPPASSTGSGHAVLLPAAGAVVVLGLVGVLLARRRRSRRARPAGPAGAGGVS